MGVALRLLLALLRVKLAVRGRVGGRLRLLRLLVARIHRLGHPTAKLARVRAETKRRRAFRVAFVRFLRILALGPTTR